MPGMMRLRRPAQAGRSAGIPEALMFKKVILDPCTRVSRSINSILETENLQAATGLRAARPSASWELPFMMRLKPKNIPRIPMLSDGQW